MWIQRQPPLPFKSLWGADHLTFEGISLPESKQYFTRSRFFNTGIEIPYLSAATLYLLLVSVTEIFSLVFPCKNFIPWDQSAGIFFLINHTPPSPPHLKTSDGRLLNNDKPGVRFINTWDLQLLFSQLWIRGSFRLDSYFYVLPLFQKYILRIVTWLHEKAVKTKDNNLVNWQSINSSNSLQYFVSGTPSKGGKCFCEVIVNYLWKQSWSLFSLERQEKKKSRDGGEYIWEIKTNFLF